MFSETSMIYVELCFLAKLSNSTELTGKIYSIFEKQEYKKV